MPVAYDGGQGAYLSHTHKLVKMPSCLCFVAGKRSDQVVQPILQNHARSERVSQICSVILRVYLW